MNKSNTRILKILIGLVCILILCIIITIFLATSKREGNIDNSITNDTANTDINEEIKIEEGSLIELENEFTDVKNVNEYFTIKNILEEYIDTISNLNMTELNIQEEFMSSTIEMSDEDIANYLNNEIKFNAKKIENYFDDDFNKKYNISNYDNIENLKQQLGSYKDTYIYIEDMYVIKPNDRIYAYYVKSDIIEKNNKEKTNNNFLIITDSINNTFMIYTENYMNDLGYSNISKGSTIRIDVSEIKNKKYNVYKDVDYDKEKYVLETFDIYKKMVQYNTEMSYDMLEEDYKNLRFEDIDNYKKYIETIYEEIINANVSKYKISTYPNYKQFICLDENNNYYIINVTKPGDFTICLDNYTILSGVDEATYEDSFPNSRCTFNVNRFLKGINNQNYNFSYSVLADSFKTSKYSTKEEFIKFVQENLFKQNEIGSIEWSMTNEEIYKGEATIVDATGESSKKINMTFLVDLKSGTNFELSFTKE